VAQELGGDSNYRRKVGWLAGWLEHQQGEHAAWLGGVGTTVAAVFGVAAFIWQVAGSRQRVTQARRAQARRVWFLMGKVSAVFSTNRTDAWRLSADKVRVANDSDEVISWVRIELMPIYQSKDGKITRIPHEHTEENLTNQGVSMIGPGGHWLTEGVSIYVPNLGLDGTWLWECTIVFEDAAGVRWSRTGDGQRLIERPKTRAERRSEAQLLR
jgi:hypothetical protein